MKKLLTLIALLMPLSTFALSLVENFEWLEPNNEVEIVVGKPYQLKFSCSDNSLPFTNSYASSWNHYDFAGGQHMVDNPTGYSIDENGVITGLKAGSYAIKFTGFIQPKDGVDKMLFITVVSGGGETESNTINGHEYVDLGLPSGKLWAKMNYGANSEGGYGMYMDWSSRNTIQSVWGNEWSTPSNNDFVELCNECTISWGYNVNSVYGCRVTGKNGNSIFLPASGFKIRGNSQMEGQGIYYWSDNEAGAGFAYALSGSSSSDISTNLSYNHSLITLPIRPVANKNDGNTYKLIYMVDGIEYKSYDVEYGSVITPEPAPTKEGYTFSGWSDIPATMPAYDVTVIGSFTINTYKLIYMVDGIEYKSYDVEYGSVITPEPAPTKEGYTFSGWSNIPAIMPAYDVTVIGTFTIKPDVIIDQDYVDLGLPSGLLWATCNLGASSPEEVGGYYAWGETSPKTYFSSDNYKYKDNSILLSDISGTEYDAATSALGGTWRIPTKVELEELAMYCTRKETTFNGIACMKFTGPNGNFIYIPKGGIGDEGSGLAKDGYGLWSSTRYAVSSAAYRAWEWTYISYSWVWQGIPIRPVTSEKPSEKSLVINEENFPDENFRAYLKERTYGKDGIITEEEIKEIRGIEVYEMEISDLKGIEYFTALEYLYCYDNQLTDLDMSKNTALNDLWCENNQLTSLDVSKNTALQRLACSSNQLTSLDVSKNTALITLYCSSNQLTSLDVSKNTALQRLACSSNQLTSFDVSKNTALQELGCSSNQLTNLDVSRNTALQELYCYRNQIKGKAMDALVNSLPVVNFGYFYVIDLSDVSEGNVCTTVQVDIAKGKGWYVYARYITGESFKEYAGSEPSINDIPGDVNGDGLVNVTDIVATVNYIMEKPSPDFNKDAADMNGDGSVNVTDIVMMVSVIMSGDGGSSRRAAATSGNLVISGHNIQLRNAENYIAARFDINLSDGQSISDIVLNGSSNHDLHWKMIDASTCRVVVYSMTNTAFGVNGDNLFNIFINGGQRATISNELLVKAENATGIDAIRKESENGKVYDLNGRQVNSPRKGVYIINGKKVVVK